jgi:SAM-dependent methyltransferase
MKEIGIWKQLTQLPFLTLYTNLINSAMQMDVFSQLSKKVTAKEVADKMGWNEANTGYFLSALVSVGFVKKEGDFFINSEEAEKYLVKGKPEYLGGFLLYYGMNEGSMPMDVVKLVTEGPQPIQKQAVDQQLDFAQYGALLRQAQEGYREQEILRIVRSLPENGRIRKILDAGCATGLLGLAVIKDMDERKGVLFDQLPKELLWESVEKAKLENRVEVISGNFMNDDLGKNYDMIMAVSVMLFAKGNMEHLMKKFYDALNPGGVLLVVSEGIERDVTGPWDMVMGYLPYYFQGMDLGVKKDEVVEAARRAGFKKFEKRSELLCSGTQDIDIIRK